MPRYTYKCAECQGTFLVFHSMKESIEECELCTTEGALQRVPSAFNSQITKGHGKKKAGEVVKAFIEESREEVKKEKEKMKREYKP